MIVYLRQSQHIVACQLLLAVAILYVHLQQQHTVASHHQSEEQHRGQEMRETIFHVLYWPCHHLQQQLWQHEYFESSFLVMKRVDPEVSRAVDRMQRLSEHMVLCQWPERNVQHQGFEQGGRTMVERLVFRFQVV